MKRIIYSFVVYMALIMLTACTSGIDKKNDVIAPAEDISEDEKGSDELTENEVGKSIPTEVTSEEESTESEESPSEMEVHFLNVGEAAAVLIICDGEAMLADAGNPDQGTAIRLYLKKREVEKLKYLLLTHSDKDHIGGAASVVSNVDIDNLFMCRYEKDNDVYLNLINEINYKNMTWSTPAVGSQYKLGGATISIIAPNRDYDNPNDSSIAFIVDHGANSFIFTGDAESPAETDIVNNGIDISADVYYVGHHGSNTSSTQEFLDKVSPEYAVISCGEKNKYGHPHIETLEKLKSMNVKLYRTDVQGTIVCYSDGTTLVFNTEPTDNWDCGNLELDESESTQVKEAVAEASSASERNTNETDENNN